jgi:hypothetical protein
MNTQKANGNLFNYSHTDNNRFLVFDVTKPEPSSRIQRSPGSQSWHSSRR